MINIHEAKELALEIDKGIERDISERIKRRSINGHCTLKIDFLQGSNYDIQSGRIMKKLSEHGFDVEYVIDKYLFVDFGFRHIMIRW